MANLSTRTINELCTGENGKQYRFNIPTYQRGYRWEEHVDKLLDDLYEYITAKANEQKVGKFYCLQPIVILRDTSLDDRGIGYEVIDGQQRLTTIFIMLKALKYEYSYLITYERDKGNHEREDYLNNIAENVSEDFIRADYYYISGAYNRTKLWLDKKANETGKRPELDIATTLVNNTRIIWYELPHGSVDAREEFRNINDGKIQLTNSELIKAMMLNDRYYRENNANIADITTLNRFIRVEQERKARVWDEIERALSDRDFWTFIFSGQYERDMYNTRIDYLFELLYCKDNETSIKRDMGTDVYDKLVMEYFENKLIDNKSVTLTWNEALRIFRIFEDWFSRYAIFNYVGFMIHYKIKKNDTKIQRAKSILRIINKSIDKNRVEFEQWFCNEIKNELNIDEELFEQLSYYNNRIDIEKLLMLFNIEICNKMEKRFNFYTESGWSVEHIFAQKSIKIAEADRRAWLEGYKRVIKSAIRNNTNKKRTGILNKLDKDISNYDGTNFDDLFERIIDEVEAANIDVDDISNFALLGASENTSLSNSPFYEKRERLIRLLEEGKNIPPGTVNVFMKFYAGAGTSLDYWSADDGKAYYNRLVELLSKFLIEVDDYE